MADDVVVTLRADISDIQRDLNTLRVQMTGLQGHAEKVGTKTESAIGGALKSIGPQVAAAFSVTALIAFSKKAVDIAIQFEKLSATLANTLGSKSLAQKAFNDIKDFAAKTNFSVLELTESFVKLSNSGFSPTTNELRKLADLANSTGKSFDQLTEAIIDAQTGEFERLKEFGVRAQKEGDNVKFTFKGVETQTKFTNEAIREYILSLGDLSGVSGSTASISETLGGKLSNVGDAMDAFAESVGQLASPIIANILNSLTNGLNALKRAISDSKKEFKDSIDIEDRYTESINEAGNALRIRFRELRANFSDEQKRSEIIKDINNKYSEYLPNLLSEKTTFQQLNGVLSETEKKLTNKITLSESEKEINKLYQQQKEQLKAISDLEKARDITARQQPDRATEVRTSFNELISRQKIELQQTSDLISLIEKESAAYSNLTTKKKESDFTPTLKKEKSSMDDLLKTVEKLTEEEEKRERLLSRRLQRASLEEGRKVQEEINKAKDSGLTPLPEDGVQERAEDLFAVEDENPAALLEARKQGLHEIIDASQQFADQLGAINDQISEQVINGIIEGANAQQQALDEEYRAKLKAGGDKLKLEEEYQARVKELNDTTNAQIRAERIKQFNIDKALAIANITIDTAQGVAKVIATAGPAAPFLAPIVAGIGAAQIALVTSQQPPKYEKGGKIKGNRHSFGGVLIEAEGGEYITPIHATSKYLPELEAMRNNTFERMKQQEWIQPALKKAKKEYEADLKRALSVNASLNDRNLIISDMKTRDILYQILEVTKENKKQGNFRFRNV